MARLRSADGIIEVHGGHPADAIATVRRWLAASRNHVALPGADALVARYEEFSAALPELCDAAKLELNTLEFVDFARIAARWLTRTLAM